MNRRDFLKAATGAAGGAAAAGVASPVAAQEQTTQSSNGTASGNGTGSKSGGKQAGSGGGGGGGGGTATVEVGPGGNYVFTPGTNQPLYATPGTTVEFVWKSNNHNIVVESQPDGANWSGHEPIENSGFTYTHTFDTIGTYEYYCQPHQALGMVGTITINESGQAPGGGGGGHQKLNPEHMGVPFQAHYVGIATVVMLVVSLVYTFFFVKYGESPHSSSPDR